MDETNYKFHSGTSVLVASSPEPEEFPLSIEVEENTGTLERDLSGASSGCQQDGAGEPGHLELMTKMMMMMVAGNQCFPGNDGVPSGVLPSGNDGLLSLANMSGGGFPAMISLMSGNGMAAMMGKRGLAVGQMGVAKLFDCIIDMSLAREDSEGSEADAGVAIPCQYCSRSFSSQMSLKTHILVAHDKEDTSVLNIGEFVPGERGRHSSQNGARQRQSQDTDISAAQAAGSGLEASDVKFDSAGDHSAAGRGRGMKRGRKGDLETSCTGGAADDVASYHNYLYSMDHLEAVSSAVDSQQYLDTRKHKVHLPPQQSFPGDSATNKRSKVEMLHLDSDPSGGDQQEFTS